MKWMTKARGARAASAEANGKPKVLIGVAGFHGVTPEAQENFFALAYHCGRRCPEYDFLLKIAIKREQFRARNNLVDLAVINGCDYLLMLDDDMIVPPDLFPRLVAHDKEVIGALYFQRGGAYHPVLMKRYAKKDGLVGVDFLNHFDPMILKRGLYELDGVLGGGCLLFKMDVFTKIEQPYFWIDGIVGTDVHICQQLRDAGVKLWVDTTLELGHVGEAKIISSRTVPQYAETLGKLNEELWEDLREYLDLNEEQLGSEMFKASESASRVQHWNAAPRTTWTGVRDYYRDFGTWHVLNLARFNLRFDWARDFAINNLPTIAERGQTVVDMGCGIGYCTLPLVRNGYRVIAMDLADTPTMKFFDWRMQKHGVTDRVQTVKFEEPVPPDLPAPADGILLISVFDHLWEPLKMLDWIDRNIKRGGWMFCDTLHNVQDEDEPQHVIRYDAHRIEHDLRKRGWVVTPENPHLFIKET